MNVQKAIRWVVNIWNQKIIIINTFNFLIKTYVFDLSINLILKRKCNITAEQAKLKTIKLATNELIHKTNEIIQNLTT